ncbi:MAG TPA: hypothetical protein VG204_13635 [Terriglobia bacterium]|nr:hypothetical protein [Terriglobia bacterium]
MSDYNFLMESRLSPEQMQVLNALSRIAAGQGVNLYLVGGAVRDLIHGQPVIRDLDFVVEGNPQKILRLLAPPTPAKGGKQAAASEAPRVDSLIYDRRLDAADLHFASGVRAELAAGRNEIYSRPGRSPEIQPADIFEDLRRRDFSANAMAVSLHPNSRGLLLDPTNGAADINQREFRVLTSRSFVEDPSRIYRLLRLGQRLDFKPEARTAIHLESALENRVWENLAAEQQGIELRAILQEENPARVLKMLVDRGLLRGLDRKLAATRIAYERFARIRAALRALPDADPFLLNFHCLTEKAGGQRVQLAKKILPDPRTVKAALDLEREARKLAHLLGSGKAARPSQVYALLTGAPRHLILFLLVHYPQVKIQSRIKSFLFKFPQVRARLPRAELQAMGIAPGPKFEKIMERIFLDQLDGKIKGHTQLLKELRSLAGIKEPEAKPKPKPAEPKPVKTKPSQAKSARPDEAKKTARKK